MSIPIYAQPHYFGPIGINITTLTVALFVLLIAVYLKFKKKQTKLFEWGLLLLILSVVFQTLHDVIILHLFPISLPKQPLFDNGLTLNYTLTTVLAYTVVPLLIILALNKHLTVEDLGFRVNNWKHTITYSIVGLAIAATVFLTTEFFFHQQWVQGYTQEGMILWIALVSILSVILQTTFFIGILFNRYLGKESTLLLSIITFLAYRSYIGPNTLPWQVCSIITFGTMLYLTWKTRNIYGACLIAVTVSLIEISLQVI